MNYEQDFDKNVPGDVRALIDSLEKSLELSGFPKGVSASMPYGAFEVRYEDGSVGVQTLYLAVTNYDLRDAKGASNGRK